MMNGIMNIYKEQSYTSHDVVARLRGILHTKKIGHTGTLDPMAEGVLPVCVGAATKLCDSFSDDDKEYVAVMLLGKTYDTLDVTGTLQETREVMSTEEEVRSAISSFIGGYDQIPPMYSAKKVDGKKLCDIARSGKTVERKPVFVKIYDIEVLSADLPRVKMRVHCQKGTYIRSLIDDIGKKLGCGAAMEQLTRTRAGRFTSDEAYRLDQVEAAMADGTITSIITDLETVFADLESIHTDPALSKLLRNGNVIRKKELKRLLPTALEDIGNGTRVRMYDSDGIFTGVYEYEASKGLFRPYKMFLN